MRAEVEGVDVRAVRLQPALQCGVDLAHVVGGVEAEGDTALVGDDDDAQARAVEASDGLGYTGQWLKFAVGGNVAAFRQLAIEDPSRSRKTVRRVRSEKLFAESATPL